MSSAPRLFLVTDLEVADEASACRRLEQIFGRVRSEAVVVGLRDHLAPTRRRLAFGHELARVAHSFRARMVVHDRVDLARLVGADGVHLGARSIGAEDARRLLGPPSLLSRSCHDEAELHLAEGERVDFVTLSPLYASPGKGAPLGEERFATLRKTVPTLPVLALGGIDASHVARARALGADGVAMVRGAWENDGWERTCDALVEAWPDAARA